jgi:hypothetical protein
MGSEHVRLIEIAPRKNTNFFRAAHPPMGRSIRSLFEGTLVLISICGMAGAQTATQSEPHASESQGSFEILRQQAERSEKAAEATAHAFDRYTDVLKAEGERERSAIKDSLEVEHAILDHGMTVFTSNVTFFGWALAVLMAAVGTVLALLGWSTRHDIEDEVKKQLERNTAQAIKDRIASFEREIEEDFRV